MKNQLAGHVFRTPISCQCDYPSSSNQSLVVTHGKTLSGPFKHKVDRMKNMMNKHGQKADNLCMGSESIVIRIGSTLSETVKGKLSMGGQDPSIRRSEESFQANFRYWRRREAVEGFSMLLIHNSSPILASSLSLLKGLPFAVRDQSKFPLQMVSIPLRNIKRVNQSANVKMPSQKYMEIVTIDNFEFWYMGFLNYQKAFHCLQQALSQSQI
ncbi:GEM-like protein 6 [Vitis vinifera]|uniref:GEM-like protein 6 n=1 Tax=Vitis vinifera TaxID=29760 RepID=A0A438K592_VITVI|nr:GEM-like protein 6 [Vitis vinifera]